MLMIDTQIIVQMMDGCIYCVVTFVILNMAWRIVLQQLPLVCALGVDGKNEKLINVQKPTLM